jgi:predicted Fe-Mo cluster-binding NifX family protein
MKIGIVLGDPGGLESEVCAHFGQCSHFLIVEVEGKRVSKSTVVSNGAQHGGGNCLAVDEIRKHGVTHVIAGGMGMGAQQKFAAAGIKIFGFSGKAKDGVAQLLSASLRDGIDPCREHGHEHH